MNAPAKKQAPAPPVTVTLIEPAQDNPAARRALVDIIKRMLRR